MNVVYLVETKSSKLLLFLGTLETLQFIFVWFFFCRQSGFESCKVSAPLPWTTVGALLPVEGCACLILTTDYCCFKEVAQCVFKDGWFALICPSFTPCPCAA